MINKGKRGAGLLFDKGRTQCRELPLCAGSGEGCQWQALPLPVQCEETATRTRDLPVTGGKTLPLAPGPPFKITLDRDLQPVWYGVSLGPLRDSQHQPEPSNLRFKI